MSQAAAIVLQKAAAQVREDELGRLMLGRRETVYAALGPRDAQPGDPPGAGRRLRTELAIRTCEHVLDLWRRERPEDPTPGETLDLARDALAGRLSPAEARSRAGRAWARVENLTQMAGDPNRLTVGFACAAAVRVALADEWFDPRRLDPYREDGDMDIFEADAAFLASIAAAGGPPWAPRSDPAARRDFWLWWLGAAQAVLDRGPD